MARGYCVMIPFGPHGGDLLEEYETKEVLRGYFELVAQVNPGTRDLFFREGEITEAAWSSAAALDLLELYPYQLDHLSPLELSRLLRDGPQGKKLTVRANTRIRKRPYTVRASLLDWLTEWHHERKPEYLLVISLEVHGITTVDLQSLRLDGGKLQLPRKSLQRWEKAKPDPIDSVMALLAGAPRIFTWEEIQPHIKYHSTHSYGEIKFVGPLWESLGCLGGDPEECTWIQVNKQQVPLYLNRIRPGETRAQSVVRQLWRYLPDASFVVNGEQISITMSKEVGSPSATLTVP